MPISRWVGKGLQSMNRQSNMCRQLSRLTKSRLALSTVVTTLIVLVVAVLLAGVVTYFAINVTSTRVQEESLALAKQHVWFDYSTGKAQAAIMVINEGGRDVVVGKITVRGQVCDWSKIFYNLTGESISGDLASSSTLTDGDTISVGGTNHIFKQATNDLTIQSGKTLIIYISNPDSISVNDVGLTVSVNIFTSQAMYYKETNVQGSGGTATQLGASDGITVLYAEAYYLKIEQDDVHEIAMVLTNSQSSDETISLGDLIIAGQPDSQPIALLHYAEMNLQVTDDLPFILDDYHVQTYLLSIDTAFTLHAGETAIVYFSGSGQSIQSGDVGNPISVGISLDSGGSATKTVIVKTPV
jgi:hypothetical protein